MNVALKINPYCEALGLAFTYPRPGECRLELKGGPATHLEGGAIPEGVILSMLDAGLGHAVASRLADWEPFATVALQVIFHDLVTTRSALCEGEASPVPAAWRETQAQGRVCDGEGRLAASGQAWFARIETAAGSRRVESAPPSATSFTQLMGLFRTASGLRFTVRPEHLNADGVAHGGAIAAALDGAMRGALQEGARGELHLRSFTVRYIQPVLLGEAVLIPAVERRGRAFHFAQACLESPGGRLLAAASATYGGAWM